MVILEVPDYEYDIVKSRGAIWDKKISKWCASRQHFKDLCEWIPFYKERYDYKELFELGEFEKIFENSIDIINQYLYLCITNIACPHCLKDTPVVFKISCYEYSIDDGMNQFIPFGEFAILPLKDIFVMNKSNPVIYYLYEYLHNRVAYNRYAFEMDCYDDTGHEYYRSTDYLYYNICHNCHKSLHIEDEKDSLWFSGNLDNFMFDVVKVELKYDLIYSIHASPGIYLNSYYYKIPDKWDDLENSYHTEAFDKWESEDFYKSTFFAKWKQKLKNAEVVKFQI